MLKLNLLPPNIYEPRKKRTWFAVFVVIWLVLAGGLIAWQLSLVNLKTQKSEELQQQEAIVRQVEQTEQEAQNTRALVSPLLTRVQLADEVFKYNKQFPSLYRQVRRWTIDSVRYDNMGVAQGMVLQAQAVTRDLDEMARYLQVMLQCPLFTGVSISWGIAGTTATTGAGGFGAPSSPYGAYGGGLPGAGTGQLGAQQTPQGIIFTVAATLREPLMNPVQQVLQQLAMGMGGMGAAGGMGGPMMGGPMMGGPMMGGPMRGAPMMGAPTMGAPGLAGPTGAPPSGMGGGMGAPLGGRGAVAE